MTEQAAGRLMHWRRLAARADNLALCYQAAIGVTVAARYTAEHFSDTT